MTYELKWGNAPERGVGKRGSSRKYTALVEQLKAQPGEWASFDPSPESPHAVASVLRHDRYRDDGIEVTVTAPLVYVRYAPKEGS